MQTLTFLWPYAAFALLALIPISILNKRRHSESSYLVTNLVSVITKLNISVSNEPRVNLPSAIFIFIWVLMTFAFMRPQYMGKPLEIARSGRSVFLTLDISESMEAEDLVSGQSLDRLSVAKQVLSDFIDHRKGDRLALVLFGSESFLHAPLSFDHQMIKHFLHEAQIGFLGPKTAIGDAIGLSVKKLMEQPKEEDRVMILLTDGQNNAGILQPMQAAKLAQEHKVKIYIVGVGSSRMVVEGFFGRSAINPSQDLDEAEPQLKKIAELTGGAYYRAKDQKSLENIYKIIDSMEPILVDAQVIIPKKELFYWPLGFAAMLFLLQFLNLKRRQS